MNRKRQGFHTSHVYSLWQDLLHHTIIFWPSDLDLELWIKYTKSGV